MDHPYFNGSKQENKLGFTLNLEDTLEDLKAYARETNKEFADYLGINHSAAITCIKPSGTVSQLVDSSSGIHPRYAPFYIRAVRGDNKDVVTQYLKQIGVPWEPEIAHPDTISVFNFPMRSPDEAITISDRNAIQQLELYKVYADHWCEHNASVSIYVKETEWIKVLAWVYENWNSCNGLSFFPSDDHIYDQAPYQAISEDTYHTLLAGFPVGLNFSEMIDTEDTSEGYQELACKAGLCEI